MLEIMLVHLNKNHLALVPWKSLIISATWAKAAQLVSRHSAKAIQVSACVKAARAKLLCAKIYVRDPHFCVVLANTCGVQVKDLTRALRVGRRVKAPGHCGTLGHALAVGAGRARHLAQLGTGVQRHVGLDFGLLGRRLLLVGHITLPSHNQTFRHVILNSTCQQCGKKRRAG